MADYIANDPVQVHAEGEYWSGCVDILLVFGFVKETIFQPCRDGATASWVLPVFFRE